ncbi:hypothetical protein FE772_00910 [Lysobacter enzymogenes]|nr:hypothetical protein [Lysobacter enzymogenes]QCW24443.1 hypothetical protein FE772_00910 [Lysobacter enzymogenes]
MTALINENLLRKIALAGEIDGYELVDLVPRKTGSYTDFYGVAAMIQSGYIAANTAPGTTFGHTTRQSAALLCQLSLKEGQSFQYGEVLWRPWDAGPVVFFITGAGLLKLEELDAKKNAARQKRLDYGVSAFVALLAAALSTTATHMYAQYRDSLNNPVAPQVQPATQNSIEPKPPGGST